MTTWTIFSVLSTVTLMAATATLTAAETTDMTAPTSKPGDALALPRWALGTWVLDGKWANGNPIHARAVYEAGPGDQFVRATTFVRDAAGKDVLRDVVIYGLREGRLVQWTFAQDGSVREVTASPTADGSLFFEWTKPAVGGKPAIELRQRFTQLDDGRLRWQTFMLSKGEWHQVISGDFERSSPR